jgi:dephospho-CoA kinase
MKRIVIAGGIGAGKSAISDRLRDRGYTVIDADDVAHDVTAKGSPAFRALVDAFGSAVFSNDGALDRAFMAEIVFNDASALRRLNRITHGAIGLEIVRRLDEATGDAAFVAVPLFRRELRTGFKIDEVWAVQVAPETAVRRLIEGRGFIEADARARLASQMSNDERSAIVDRVIWNEGTLDELYAQLDEALELVGLARG